MTPKERVRTWRENQLRNGNKIMTVSVPEESHQILRGIRQETGESYGKIIGRLLATGSTTPCKDDFKQVTIEIPEESYKRLIEEYPGEGGLKTHLENYITGETESLFLGDEGDF